MYLLGYSLNTVTLLSLSLVVGMLVDDAIVEIENIERHLLMGKTPFQAAMEAADEIGLAVIATTFTLIAVFLPTAFMSGIAGKFFKQFGWTASLAVFASLVVARMLTPMMAAYLMKPFAKEHAEPRWLSAYLKMAAWCVRHRWVTMLGALAFFVGSIMLIPLLPQGFIPADDNSQTQVYLELPPGTTLARTRASAEAARALVVQVPHVRSVYTTIGGGAAGGDPFAPQGSAEVRKATLTIQLDPRGARPVKQQIENQIRAALEPLPGARTKVGLGGSGEKYILVLTGDDPAALTKAALDVERDLRTIPGLGSIASTASLIRPEIAVRPDFARAADLGVTSSAIGETLRIATVGDYDWALPKFNLAQRQVPIVVKLDDAARKDLDLLSRLTVNGIKGPVTLGQVATLEPYGGPAVIDRYDRSRNINFEIELSGLPLGDVAAAVQELPAVKSLPAGVKVVGSRPSFSAVKRTGSMRRRYSFQVPGTSRRGARGFQRAAAPDLRTRGVGRGQADRRPGIALWPAEGGLRSSGPAGCRRVADHRQFRLRTARARRQARRPQGEQPPGRGPPEARSLTRTAANHMNQTDVNGTGVAGGCPAQAMPIGPLARRATRRVSIAWGARQVRVGGAGPVVVQSMTNTDTADAIGTAIQIGRAHV